MTHSISGIIVQQRVVDSEPFPVRVSLRSMAAERKLKLQQPAALFSTLSLSVFLSAQSVPPLISVNSERLAHKQTNLIPTGSHKGGL